MIVEQGYSGFGGAVTAPHHLAAQAGGRVLTDGGNAIEAMIAAAACIAVVYPHMNGLGGDNFWLIHPGRGIKPVGFDACGAAAGLADAQWYRESGYEHMPLAGPTLRRQLPVPYQAGERPMSGVAGTVAENCH